MAAAVMPFEMPDDEMAYNANAMRLNTMVNAEEVNMRRPKRTKSPVDQIHSNKAKSRSAILDDVQRECGLWPRR